MQKSQVIGKDPDAGKDWRQEEKRTAEDELVRQHHQHNGHEFEQTLEDSGGQRNPVCCSPLGSKGPTGLSNWTTKIQHRLGGRLFSSRGTCGKTLFFLSVEAKSEARKHWKLKRSRNPQRVGARERGSPNSAFISEQFLNHLKQNPSSSVKNKRSELRLELSPKKESLWFKRSQENHLLMQRK